MAKGARVLLGRRAARGAGLLLPAHGPRGRRPHDARHARGDVRPGAAGDGGRLARRGDPARQRQRATASRPAAGRAARRRRARLQRELVAGVVSINDHVSSFGEPHGALGRREVRAGSAACTASPGLREMVQPKYVSLDRGSKAAELWWYPVRRASSTRSCRRAAPALYSTSLLRRARRPARAHALRPAVAPLRPLAPPRERRQALLRHGSGAGVTQLSRSQRPKWHYVAVGVGLIVVAVVAHRRLADPGRARDRGTRAVAPGARRRVLLRQPPLPAPDRRPRAHRHPAAARGAPQRAAVELRERGDARAEDAGRLAEALPRHARVPRAAGRAPRRSSTARCGRTSSGSTRPSTTS